MLNGEKGNRVLGYRKGKFHVYYEPVERTGWSMCIVIRQAEIFGKLRRLFWVVTLMQLVGLLMLGLIMRAAARSQKKYFALSENKEKMENELRIASEIQKSMIPKTFPPFPERKDIDMAATIIPAKEVGGDLYDFYIRDEKLFFCIGDVSGKGVPASLVMAVTRSLFRTIATHQDSPKQIIQMMNDAIADNNESNMFVTLFCGTLDLKDGHLVFCNAGHNAPEIISDGVRPLDVLPNLPVGVLTGMDFKEQETFLHEGDTIFLYTDGLSEAENQAQELFGEQRLEAALQPGLTAVDQLRTMHRAVHTFVGEAEQSDDLTMLCIRFLGGNAEAAEKGRRLVLRNDIGQISRLADFVGSLAREEQLSEPLEVSLNLALEEAVTNVIMYAYPQGQEGQVDLQAVRRPDALEFTLTDSGKPFDPTAAPEADTTLGVQERPIGGLGIFLVRKIMDTVAYRRSNGKNILTMIKHI
jgi:sigma-B regulation protein RsbU (phosphoserine phosphatase)